MTAEVPQGQSPDNLRRVLMPPKETIVHQFEEAGFFGVLPQTDAFYEAFAGYIGGRNMPPGGFNLFWEIASVELSDLHAHRQVRLGVHYSFESYRCCSARSRNGLRSKGVPQSVS